VIGLKDDVLVSVRLIVLAPCDCSLDGDYVRLAKGLSDWFDG
jgi:hypothetical protein